MHDWDKNQISEVKLKKRRVLTHFHYLCDKQLGSLKMQYNIGKFLAQIDSPQDLKEKFSLEQLPTVANELREYLIDVLSDIGNSHFSASLGVIELAVALHYVYNTPYDRLVWDIGHQAYGHKVLTGRRDVFPTNRLLDGICGFPRREESEYDTFGVGHSSTSISALLGMAVASNYKKENRYHVAVIGDGAMTAGLAFEGLNNLGAFKDLNILIILNDNGVSIDPEVGALIEHLKQLKAGTTTNNLFESLSIHYEGPIDGHDVVGMVKKIQELKDVPGPKILHCITKKGKGFKFSEEGNPTQWHAPGAFDKDTGVIIKNATNKAPKYQDVFGETLVELAEKNEQIVGVTAAMPTGTSMIQLMNRFPNRTFDVGIAEQHAVTFSAGLATEELIPFCALYSTFTQRAYDQIIHDVALQDLKVIFCLDRAGIVGADGATHHGAYDIAFLRTVPNMIVAAPMNEMELRNLMYTAQLSEQTHPFSIRYPRGKGQNEDWKLPFERIEIGKGRRIKQGIDLAILSFGTIGNQALTAIDEVEKQGKSIALYDMRFAKPLDKDLLKQVFGQFNQIITLEDGAILGGFGSAVSEYATEIVYHGTIQHAGIPDAFIQHGTPEQLQHICGYDVEGLVRLMQQMLD